MVAIRAIILFLNLRHKMFLLGVQIGSGAIHLHSDGARGGQERFWPITTWLNVYSVYTYSTVLRVFPDLANPEFTSR